MPLGFVGACCEGPLSLALSPSLTHGPFPPRRSSNRTCRFPASGSRTGLFARRVGADVHAAPTSCTSWLHLGRRVQFRLEIFELCKGCRLTPISRCVLSLRSILNQGPFPPRSLPASSVLRAPPTPGPRHAPSACSGRHPSRTRSPVLRTSPFAHMPRPTTPVEHPAMLRRPSRWTHGLPRMCARSASTIALSGPARASLTLRPAGLLDLLSEAFCLWASSPRVTPRPRQIATEGVDFLLGRDFHPLVRCTFHGARTLGAHEENEGKEKPSNPLRLLGFSGWKRRQSNPLPQPGVG